MMMRQQQTSGKSRQRGKVLVRDSFASDRTLLTDQRGSVLLLALVMLVIMSALGMLAMSTSSTEQSISGNFRAKREAFYAADRAIAYVAASPLLFSAASDVNLQTDATHRDNIASGRSGLDPAKVSKAKYEGSGALPVKSKSDAMMFEARYITVDVTGAYPIDPLDASAFPNRARVSIESQVVRIVPK